jgi:hypothetical protein
MVLVKFLPRILLKKWQKYRAMEEVDRLYARPDGNDIDREVDCNSAKQIAMFLVILAVVSAAIVAFIIYTSRWINT